MRTPLKQIVLVLAAAAGVVSCDTRLPTAGRQNGDIDVEFITPAADSEKVNIGDSVEVEVVLESGSPITRLTLRGDGMRGVKELGTYVEVARYAPIVIQFAQEVTDTTIRRYMKADSDLQLDTLAFIAIVEDERGRADTARRVALQVSGPRITIIEPGDEQRVAAPSSLNITARATDADNVRSITYIVRGLRPAPAADTVTQAFAGGSITEELRQTLAIPALPVGTRIGIKFTSTDFQGQEGSAPEIFVTVRADVQSAAPHVMQEVPLLSEVNEPIMVSASGQNITDIGVVVREGTVELLRRTVNLGGGVSNVRRAIPLNLPLQHIGKRVTITAFAIAGVGAGAVTGYAVRTATSAAVTDITLAIADPTEIVHGVTYELPLPGLIADIVVDTLRSNVFLSNTVHNRLEMWNNTSQTFLTQGVAVGSLPWGMAISPETVSPTRSNLLVANSGGTNISQVDISLPAPKEKLVERILTRNSYVHQVLESRDANTGRITASVSPVIGYSDRPQHIAQLETGRIYFSTRPTSFAPQGTLRYLEPKTLALPFPDPRIIWQYVDALEGTVFQYTIFNVDSVFAVTFGAGSGVSDRIVVYDHPYGQGSGVICVNGFTAGCVRSTLNGVVGAPIDESVRSIEQTLRRLGSDAEAVLRLDLPALALKDTTFAANSGDHKWVAFGEGNSAPGNTGARTIMVGDVIGNGGNLFISPWQSVRDLTENANERVFGLALDRTGATVAAHGLQSYFSRVDYPFHLRLQGKFDSPDKGQGIALHPDADGSADQTLNPNARLGFIASEPGEIELVDVAYYISRGRLKLKYPIYGPIRAAKPMAADAGKDIVVKLFALTSKGLIVIDVRSVDIKPGP